MTAESSTYTYETGEQETVTLKRGMADPHGHALLRINHDDGETLDCYVNTAWLRDRLDDLGGPRPAESRPLTPDAITDEMVERVQQWAVGLRAGGTVYLGTKEAVREMFTVALTEPPARPEGAEEIEALIDEWNTDDAGDFAELADHLAAHLAVKENR